MFGSNRLGGAPVSMLASRSIPVDYGFNYRSGETTDYTTDYGYVATHYKGLRAKNDRLRVVLVCLGEVTCQRLSSIGEL